MKTALVCGAGGFIGGHLVRRLKRDGLWVRAVDRNHHEFAPSEADEFILGDLRDGRFCKDAIDRPFDEVYQLAAEMGGAQFVYAGRFDADILQHCMMIDLNVVTNCIAQAAKRVFSRLQPASIRREIRRIERRLTVRKTQSIRPILTASTAGPRFLASICIWRTGAAAACRRELRAITTYSARADPGAEAAKRRPLRYAAKSHSLATATASRFSAMVSRAAPSCSYQIASRERCG